MDAKTDRGRVLRLVGRDSLQMQQRHDQDMLNLPVKVPQIGEGNFLRGFFDWMIYECNRQGMFQGSVAVSQPRPGEHASWATSGTGRDLRLADPRPAGWPEDRGGVMDPGVLGDD